ncbi:hypothetical protein NDU88_002575, partial [Pleurodeles waltl]
TNLHSNRIGTTHREIEIRAPRRAFYFHPAILPRTSHNTPIHITTLSTTQSTPHITHTTPWHRKDT